jgi:hypothetical protein
MEKAGPDTSEPKKKSIQHRRRKMVIRAGKDSGMEEEKGSEDAAHLLELEKHSSDKENSDKSEPSSSGGNFADKPDPSARCRREGRSELLSYRTRSRRKADEVKVSEGQKSARTEEGPLSRLHQGLLRVELRESGHKKRRVMRMIAQGQVVMRKQHLLQTVKGLMRTRVQMSVKMERTGVFSEG